MNINETKKLYIEGNLSQATLADITGIPLSKIKKAAKTEGWQGLKKSNQTAGAGTTAIAEMIDGPMISSSVDRLEFEATEKIIILLNNAISEACQFNKHISKLRSMTEAGAFEELVETQLSVFDTKRLLDAVKALEKAIKLRRDMASAASDLEEETRLGVVILPAADIGN